MSLIPGVLLSNRLLRYSRGAPRSNFFRPSVEHGVADSFYPNTIARTQISKAINFDMTKDGQMETRGGSIKLSDTAVASTGSLSGQHQFVARGSDGTLTLRRMLKSGTVLYEYNTSTGVYDSKITSLATTKASMVNFINAAGAEVMLYADGTNFRMYDGTTVTDILSNFTAGNATQAPRYLFVKHSVVFAAGDDANSDVLFWCDPLSPNTDWPSQGFAILEGGVDKITGLDELYNYVVVMTLGAVYLVTGLTSATFTLIKVNNETGCTSHWSIVSVGGFIYWVNAAGFQIGKLRAAMDDGMDVEYMSFNMQTTIATMTAGYWDDVEGAYSDVKKAIFWTLKTGTVVTQPDKMLVYSVVRSRPAMPSPERGPDLRYVWAGYYSGLDFNGVTTFKDADGKDEVYVVDASGFTYLMHSEFKDKRSVGATTGTDITYEIRTREETFGGAGSTARVMNFLPTMYSKHNSGFNIQFLIDGTELFPTATIPIKFVGNIPFWHDGTDPLITAEWESSIWVDKPILNAKLGLKKKSSGFIAIITSTGSNTKEEGTWIGYDMIYQRDPIPQGKAA